MDQNVWIAYLLVGAAAGWFAKGRLGGAKPPADAQEQDWQQIRQRYEGVVERAALDKRREIAKAITDKIDG